MTQTADAVVVGAGVVGASTAFHLAKLGARRVVVCERRHPAAGASGRSAAFIQLHFCLNEAEARLTLASLAYFRDWDQLVGFGTCGFVPAGYVRLEGADRAADLRTHVAMLRGIGVNTRVIGPADLADLAPYLRTEDVAVAAYEPDSGHADALATVDGFLAAAKQLGCEVQLETEVRAVRAAADGRITGLDTSRGPIETPVVVLAAGVWSAELLKSVDLDLPLLGARTQAARFRWSATPREPVVNVGDGIAFAYFHSAGETHQDVLVGLSGGARRPVQEANLYDDTLDLDYAQTCFERLKWRMPAAAAAHLICGASGPIMLTPDNLPIIDRHPALDGLYLFAGDSGSSFKTSPAVGRALAEWALLGSPRSVDVSAFNMARFNSPDRAPIDSDYYRLKAARGFTVRPAQAADLGPARALMLRTFELDFGYGYRPDYHADVDDLQGQYLDNPRHVLLVAVDDDSGDVIATAGVRSGGLKPVFNPPWLVARYDPERTAQIVRVYVAHEHRRRGLAQALVKAICQFVADDGSYACIALHTDPRSPGAERFWTAQATTLIFDDRDGPSGSIHFEMEIPSTSARRPEALRLR